MYIYIYIDWCKIGSFRRVSIIRLQISELKSFEWYILPENPIPKWDWKGLMFLPSCSMRIKMQIKGHNVELLRVPMNLTQLYWCVWVREISSTIISISAWWTIIEPTSLNCCINRWHEGKIWWLGLEIIYFHSEGRYNISLNSSEKENMFDLKHRILCVILSCQFMIVIQLWYKLESKLTILGPFVGLEDIFFWRVFDASWSGKGIQVSMFCFARVVEVLC